MPGWTVPGYTESRELGSGASGRVVLATHTATGCPVAIKYLAERLSGEPGFRRAFRAEAELLGGLDSPYVTGLYEYVEAPRGAAIVMEVVEGAALRQLIRRAGPTGPEAALAVLKGSLLGLAAAHRVGVVHRDYKPENVLVGPDGSSKLVDFGIAARDGERSDPAGTPAYMAPEQWNGESASPATDVYAATVCFFECLTGRKPYAGENLAELALQHVSAPVPDQDEDVPGAVRELIRRGLAKSPADRPANAAAFVAQLEAVAGAAYGPDWEERGQRKLVALAALLPLLFRLPQGAPGGTVDLAVTKLGRAPGLRELLLGVGTLALAVVLFAAAAAVGGAGGPVASEAAATTNASPATPGTSPDPSGTGGDPDSGPGSGSPSPADDPDSEDPGDPPGGPSEETGPSTTPPGDPDDPGDPGDGGGDGSGEGDGEDTGGGGDGPGTGDGDGDGDGGDDTDDPPAPAVRSLSVARTAQTGDWTATATIRVTTANESPVTLTVSWYYPGSKRGGRDGAAETVTLSGNTTYTFTSKHTFTEHPSCVLDRWAVRATTTPGAPTGTAGDQLVRNACRLI